MASKKTLVVRLNRSINRRTQAHQACVRGLGLRRIGQTVEVADTPSNRGMINKVSYLVSIEEGQA